MSAALFASSPSVPAFTRSQAREMAAFVGRPPCCAPLARARIARHKAPRYIRFVPGVAAPLTGKLQTFKIRDDMNNQLGLAEVPTARFA